MPTPSFFSYRRPAGGWGSVRALARILVGQRAVLRSLPVLLRQNKPAGFACVSCAWAKPAEPHPFEFCENGAKATAWEATTRRVDSDFFARHTVSQLREWTDHDLEDAGRLTAPMRWNPVADRYESTSWESAFQEIGRRLREIDPAAAVFYTSGRASLETSYMYQLMARLYGNNNLPDSSNMCHESTSVALPRSLGVGVGTVRLEDFAQTDCIFFFGQNVGSNSPRMLHSLEEASRRGAPIVTFNPLRERGLVEFTNPQSPAEMLTPGTTRISSQYHQLKNGTDTAALMGICKTLVAWDDDAVRGGGPRVLDAAFIAEHTHGFEAFAQAARDTDWRDIEATCGLPREALQQAAATYAQAGRVIGVYGMGLTQHKGGVETIRMLANLLLLRGNVGKPGAGICPVRGHSNVQGQRTVGITEKPELAPLDRLAELYRFEPPRGKGLNTVETCEGVIAGSVRAFVGLGGNFLRAAPDTSRLEPAWSRLALTVHVATKLNRSHVVPGETAFLLPCLGRSEVDVQASGPQAVSMEDSTGCFHGSRGLLAPPAGDLLSEPAIVGRLAMAAVGDRGDVPWRQWIDDYGRIREAIERTYPDIFARFNDRLWVPGGFGRPNGARERKWNTDTGKANFAVPTSLSATLAADGADVLQLMTLRSNDQFNTTIYGYEDRFRGVRGTRSVVFMNRDDMARLGVGEGQRVALETAVDPAHPRRVGGLQVHAYDIPAGCCAAYYPECNPLVPVWHHADGSFVPAAKSVPVRIVPGPRQA